MISRALSARRLLVLLLMAMVALLPATAGAATFPDTIRLPDGWQPEGIAAGRGTSLYVGSIPTGAVWKGDARTGRGDVLVEGRPGSAAPSASRSTGATGCSWPAGPPARRSSTTPAPGPTWPATSSRPRGARHLRQRRGRDRQGGLVHRLAGRPAVRRAARPSRPPARPGRGPHPAPDRRLPAGDGWAQPQRDRGRPGRPGAAVGPDQHRQAVPDQPAHRRDPRGRPGRGHPGPTATACCWPGGSCSWSRTAATRSPWSCCRGRWTGAGW